MGSDADVGGEQIVMRPEGGEAGRGDEDEEGNVEPEDRQPNGERRRCESGKGVGLGGVEFGGRV